MLLGPIGIVVVILFISIRILSGPIRNKLMEKGLALYHSQHYDDKDDTTARKFFIIAAKLGEADAYYYLGKLDERICDFDSAKNNYRLGIKAGSELADAGYAVLYVNTEYHEYMDSKQHK